MEFTVDLTKTSTLEDIKNGDLFTIDNNSAVYMKVQCNTPAMFTTLNRKIDCVDIKTGRLCYFNGGVVHKVKMVDGRVVNAD